MKCKLHGQQYYFTVKTKPQKIADLVCLSGAGGSRTHVRTRKPYAFYTLIPALIFERRQDLDHQPTPYLLKLHPPIGALKDYFRFACAALSSDSEPHPWGDVSFPHLVRELSLRSTVLRSSSESILVVANYFLESSDLGGKPTSHRVLTYHFISPSNPVNPITSFSSENQGFTLNRVARVWQKCGKSYFIITNLRHFCVQRYDVFPKLPKKPPDFHKQDGRTILPNIYKWK